MKRLLSAGLLLVLAAASLCGRAGEVPVAVSDGYVRLPVPGQQQAVAYMVLTNTTQEALSLASVQCSCASKVEIHSHREEGGVMKMRKEESLTLTAKQSQTLEPGGLHLMLFDFKPGFRSGDQVELVLNFAGHPAQLLTVPVKSLFDDSHHQHHHH